MEEIKVIRINDEKEDELKKMREERRMRRMQIRVMKTLIWIAAVIIAFAIGMVTGRMLAFLYVMGC